MSGAVNVAMQAFHSAKAVFGAFADEIDRLDTIGDMSERLNVSADAIQIFQRAAVIAGGDVESLNKSLAIFQRTLGDAKGGASGPAAALERLNLSAEELVDMGLDQAFKAVLGELGKLPDAATRASLGADLFGRSSMQLTELMENSSPAIQQATSDIERFGVKMDKSKESISNTQKAMEELKLAGEGLFGEAAITLGPALGLAADIVSLQMANLRIALTAPRDFFTTNPIASPLPLAPPKLITPDDLAFGTTNRGESLLREFASVVNEGLVPGIPAGPAAQGGRGNDSFAFLKRMIGVDPALRSGAGAVGGAGALEFGSAGAFSAIQASRRQDETNKLLKQEVDESKKQTQRLDDILLQGIVLGSLELQG